MRSTPFHRALLAGATLLAATAGASADDELFLPAYRRMGLIPGSPPPSAADSGQAATPAPVPAPATVGRPVASGQPGPLGRPRLAAWPSRAAQGPAPAEPAPAPRPRLGWKGSAPVVPVAPPTPTPAPGQTVAAALSVRGDDAPAYVPSSSRGMLARLRKAEPEVPPGLPRGAPRSEMVPPEPLEPGPELARLTAPPTIRAAEPAPSSAQPTIAARPAYREPSPFEPVRAGERFGPIGRDAEAVSVAATRPRLLAIPPMIARPDEPATDSPLRQVRATDNDLDTPAAPIAGGGPSS